MAPPHLDVARVQRWCVARVPEHARHEVRVECDVAPRHLTIVERRAPWQEDFGRIGPASRSHACATQPLPGSGRWRDRNHRFHAYDALPPSPRVEDLLAEIDRDPIGIFWG